MYARETVVINPTGLHARPAMAFSRAASKFQSQIRIKNLDTDSAEVNAKSTMRILTIAMSKGAKIRVIAEGEDEREAVDALIALVDSGLGEI